MATKKPASGLVDSPVVDERKRDSQMIPPTVELHRHFEAGMRPGLIAELAEKNGVSEVRTRAGVRIDEIDPQDPQSILKYYRSVERGFAGSGGFARFIDSFGLPLSVLCSLEDLQYAAFDQVTTLAAAGSLHTELRGSPLSYKDLVNAPAAEIVSAIQAGVAQAWREQNASGTFIAAFSRQKGLGPKNGPEVFRQAPAIGKLVAEMHDAEQPLAIDVAGFPEDIYPPHLFAEALAPAREAGAPLTIHCGEQGVFPTFEASPPSLVVEAIEVLGASRIGHGTCLMIDEKARALVVERGVGIECCPVSNVKMGFLPDVSAHPLAQFLGEGLLATVATDDPLMFGDFDNRSLLNAHAEELGLSVDDEWKLAENGIRTAFVSAERRSMLSKKLSTLREAHVNQS